MARQIDDRLARLRERRFDNNLPDIMMFSEQYEKRSQSKATRYALGAMQQVDPRSTQISHEEAEKVERNLKQGLSSEGMNPVVKLQGSVPINVHTRGVSDVDLLVIEEQWLRYETCSSGRKNYLPYTGKGTLCDDVLHLRAEAVKVLRRRFHGAKVDNSPAKSIQLTEGAFRRKVDVVPAHWYDTANFQQTLDETWRGVVVVNKNTRENITNYPFLYMAKINEKDEQTLGGGKMAVRLTKNVRNDAEGDIDLSSYDIGSLIHHCPDAQITSLPARDLMILSGVDRWFDELAANRAYAESLMTPDGTRQIIDKAEKWDALGLLNDELTDLTAQVEREIIGPYGIPGFDRDTIRRRLNDQTIPMMPQEIGTGIRI